MPYRIPTGDEPEPNETSPHDRRSRLDRRFPWIIPVIVVVAGVVVVGGIIAAAVTGQRFF